MSPKSLALLVVGALIIPTVFATLPMTYPSTNPVPVDHVFQNQRVSSGLSQLEGVAGSTGFNNSGLNMSSLSSLLGSLPGFLLHLLMSLWDDIRGLTSGLQSTGFSSTSGSSVTIKGYVTNASSTNSPIPSSMLTVSETEYYTQVQTGSNGYYSYVMVHQGKGSLSYFIQGFNPKIVSIDTIGLSNAWVNVTLTPAERYNISGLTEFRNNTLVPGVSVDFSSKFGSYTTQSSSSARYSLDIPNGTYGITISKRGMNPIPDPYYIIVSGRSMTNFNLIINVSGKDQFNVSGFILNRENRTISGATVGLYGRSSGNATTNSTGFYRIKVPYGIDIITAVDPAYGYNYTERNVITNLTDVNITLTNKDPMPSGSTIGQQNSTNVSKNISGNITHYLQGNNSRINYSNSTMNLTLQGNITNSLDGNPVADTSVIFYTDINGTIFADNITTNSTGHYLIRLSYTGNYSFAVNSTFYNPKFFNLNITGNTTYNFTLVPLQSHIFYVSGYVKIHGPETGLKGAYVYLLSSSAKLVKYNVTDSTGHYIITAINGNYLIKAEAVGFNKSKTLKLTLDSNITDRNFSLYISIKIGSGITQFPPGSTSGIPGVSGSSISSQLNASSGSSNATGSGPVTLTIHLVNSTSALSNTKFIAYIEIDSIQFRSVGKTNSTGNFTYDMNITGRFTILADTLYNRGNTTVVNVENNTSVTLTLTPVPVYTDTIELHNSFNTTYANNSVPENFLNQTSNYVFSISNYSSSLAGINRTYYYRLPEGNYSFTYSDKYFVQKSFWSNITSANATSPVYLQPYLIIIHANSSAEWYYNINNINGNVIIKGDSRMQVNITGETQGIHSVQLGLVLNNTATSVYSNSVDLVPGQNIFKVYSNMTNSVYETNNTTTDVPGSHIYVNGTIGLNSSNFIYAVNLSLNTSSSDISNVFLYLSGSNVNIYRNEGFLNLTSYAKIISSNESFDVTMVKNTKNFSVSLPITFYAYYVHASVKGVYS